MATKSYPLLCSGFVSTTEDKLIHDEYLSDPFVDFVLDKDYLKSRNLNSYNKNIVALFDRWKEDFEIIKDFDFREQFIKAATQAFSCYTITEWLSIQSDADTTGSLHSSFLEETMDFVYRGKARGTSINTWYRILTSDRRVTSVRFNIDDWIVPTPDGVYKNTDVTLFGFFLNWLRQPGGFLDMFITMYVIFGSRSDTIDVSNKQKV